MLDHLTTQVGLPTNVGLNVGSNVGLNVGSFYGSLIC